jgi:putative ABC transport system permease protein
MSFDFWKRRDEDLEDELQAHLRMAAQERIERGQPADEARALAQREMGNTGLIREVTRSTWGGIGLERVIQDLRFGGRILHKEAGFTVVAMLTLALGIGATTAIFSVFHGVLLQPLAYHDSNQLYGIWTSQADQAGRIGSSGPDLVDFRDQAKSFDQVGAALGFSLVFVLGGEPKRVHPTAISPEIFPMLGVRPLLGREFRPEEFAPGDQSVILSYDFWQRELGGDPNALGRTIYNASEDERRGLRVIGVMPRLPDFFPETDVWVTLVPQFEFMKWRGNRFLRVFGRLKHGVSAAQAEQELTAILRRAPGNPADLKVSLSPLRDDLVGSRIRPILILLMSAVGLVLLIASVNVATLLLARGEARRNEMDLRIMLGAGRPRLLQQLFIENLLLAMLGGLLGTGFAFGLTRLLLRFGAEQLPRTQNIAISFPVLLFALLITVAASLLFGTAPALSLIRKHREVKLEGFRATHGMRRPRRNVLVVSEVALSLMLIIGAGLLLRSLRNLVREDLGFAPDHLLQSYMRLPHGDPTVPGFYQTLLEGLPQLPDVKAVAVADCVPGMESAYSAKLSFPDRPADPAHVPTAAGCWISADYFRTTAMALVAGRPFTPHDNADAPPVVIVSQSLARQYWPSQDAIGKFVAVSYIGPGRVVQGSEKLREVVGVVADVRHQGEPGQATVYMPYVQDPTQHVLGGMNLYVRSPGLRSVAEEVKAKVRSLRADMPVTLRSMEIRLWELLSPRRFALMLLSGFALLALLLAAVGIHGVMAYSVSRRRREIGVRMALGAARETVVAMVLKEALKMVIVGLIVGAAGALACSRLIAGMLYGTGAGDPLVLASCAAIMLAVAVGAAWLPARRAASVDPMEALRIE